VFGTLLLGMILLLKIIIIFLKSDKSEVTRILFLSVHLIYVFCLKY
jgi:hypothetical protein